jgi:hypothetical protein
MKQYIYKTKQGAGGLLKAGLKCKIITHQFGTDNMLIQLRNKKGFYHVNLKDLERA